LKNIAVSEWSIFRRNAGNGTGFVCGILEQIEELTHGLLGVRHFPTKWHKRHRFRLCHFGAKEQGV
jgi:hypothetical protein